MGKKRVDAPKMNGVATAPPVLLPIITKANDHPCHECVKCCSYVAIEHDEPTTMKDYDHMVWYLYHKDISLFVDWENAWYIKFESRCENLTSQGLCAVYDHRPGICKEFDWRECENHLTPEDGPADKYVFNTADEFLAWFEERRPKTYRRYLRFMKKRHAAGEEKELQRLGEGDSPSAPA